MESDLQAGAHALAELDAILAAEPDANHARFSAATRYLSAFRNRLIAQYRPGRPTGPQRRQLDQVNATLSLVMGGQFPLGSVPWGELRQAREWLGEAVGRK